MIDVSPHAVKDGFLRNTCQAIKNALTDKAIQKNKQNIQVIILLKVRGFIAFKSKTIEILSQVNVKKNQEYIGKKNMFVLCLNLV